MRSIPSSRQLSSAHEVWDSVSVQQHELENGMKIVLGQQQQRLAGHHNNKCEHGPPLPRQREP